MEFKGQQKFYEIDRQSNFVPVELISYYNGACHVQILTDSGVRDLVVPNIYQFEKPVEPQKVTIPKFMAEWLKECKSRNLSLGQAIETVNSKHQEEVFERFGEDKEDYEIYEILTTAGRYVNEVFELYLDAYSRAYQYLTNKITVEE